ncbi:nuclear transport factor 2 family protein [Prosthecomicrobium hirschii]|uniref:nuclear transport factor 2 family protein n=1 Tax=Prosthecodimorpha hirschii TaxID=665126 RepID=UPI0022200C5D|nr:nuclear transport factor 2 family protein [Prosthecomicrobium hirschii]MCW1843074.1 nuclear transport factor 2 family protein [Prosthecomicrobium hirschii]
MTDEDRILARLDEFGRLLASRDLGIVDALSNRLGVTLFGSEAGERAGSREELLALFGGLFARPYGLAFAWQDRHVTIGGDIAWVIAEGLLHVIHPDRDVPTPYRLVGIFQRHAGAWHWRLFSGSEPAPPPA